ncbi:MAG: hypothetical protein ACJAUV_000065 [Flavobacteriales bacterium]|jgi:hypothetical protein
MKYIFSIISVVITVWSSAQEVIYPIGYLPNVVTPLLHKSAAIDTLSLPFFDDFSIDKFIGTSDNALWVDRNVYVNNTYPVNQPTAGVATFDGLDATGYPYDFSSPTTYGKADYLTSAPIDLSFPASDSIYLSFFAQAGVQFTELGPRGKDSLLVEFKNVTTGEWDRVWRKPGKGFNTYDTGFEQFLIPVKESKYLQKGFQFRFLNYSMLSAAMLMWHIDYIKLDRNRSFLDTSVPDVGFRYTKTNVLSEYSIMPWEMYKRQAPSSASYILSAEVYNNASFSKVGNSGSITVKEKGTLLKTENFGGAALFSPYSSYTYNYTLTSPLINPAWSPQSLYPTYEISYVLSTTTTPEFSSENDTLRFMQKFGPYLAYDDGTAEIGYGIREKGGKVAQEFTIDQKDTITAVKIYFNPFQENFSTENFLLTVWSSLNPEQIISRNFSFDFPSYGTGQNGYVDYKLDEPIEVNGTFYVGYTQTNEAYMNVGLDYNATASSKIFYNQGGGFINSEYPGVLMIRPVFGKGAVGINNVTKGKESFSAFPNPAQDLIQVPLKISIANISLYDLKGSLLLQTDKNQLQVSELPQGAYLLIATEDSGNITTQKIMIQR